MESGPQKKRDEIVGKDRIPSSGGMRMDMTGRSEGDSIGDNQRVLNQSEKYGARVSGGEINRKNPNEYNGVSPIDQKNTQKNRSAGFDESKESPRRSRWQSHKEKRAAVKQAILEKEKELKQTKKEKATLFSYSPVFLLALLKDLLDLVGIGSLPGIGTIITFCISILIFLLFFLIKSNSKLVDSRFIMKRGVVLLLGSMVEGFAFGLNFLPIETITIFVIFMMDRHLSDKSIERINNIIHLFKKRAG